MWFQKDKEQSIMNKIERHELEIADLKSHKAFCDSQHAEHNRRREDDVKLRTSTDLTLKAILNKIEEFGSYIPSMERTKNKYIAFDTLKSWFLFVAAIASGVTPIIVAYHFFTGG